MRRRPPRCAADGTLVAARGRTPGGSSSSSRTCCATTSSRTCSPALTLEDLADGADGPQVLRQRRAGDRARWSSSQGRIDAAEALSRTTLENALAWLVDQEMVVERERKLILGPGAERAEQRDAFRAELRSYLGR